MSVSHRQNNMLIASRAVYNNNNGVFVQNLKIATKLYTIKSIIHQHTKK